MNFKLIVVMVRTDLTDAIVDLAKEVGATGATIVPARGTGSREAKTFFGLTLEDQRDVILFLLEESLNAPVMKAVHKAGRFDQPGTGVAFVLDVDSVMGIESQLKSLKS